MDLTTNKSDLTKALYLMQSIVEKRTTMPILANILISASNGKMKLSATDLEMTATTELTADVRTKGSTTVSARVFSDIVRELPDTDVVLKLREGERLELIAGNSRLKIVGVSAEEYPSLPGVGFEVKNTVSSGQLLQMINSTIHAVSQDETRFNLNGICFERIQEGKGKKQAQSLRMIATDGHRLAMVTRPIGDFEFENKVIVPRKGISEVRKLLEGSDIPVAMGIHEGFLVLESKDTKVAVRLIDGEFPDYTLVIPKGEGTPAVVPSLQLEQALKRVSLLVSDKAKLVRFDFSKNKLRLSSSSPELGEASEDVELEYAGSALSIGFNARYVLDILGSIGEEQTLRMELHGELGPGKFGLQGDESFMAIVMPMRLTNEA